MALSLALGLYAADTRQMTLLHGSVKGGALAKVIFVKLNGTTVESTTTWYCDSDYRDFAFYFPFEAGRRYDIQVQLLQKSGDRTRTQKVAQFPLAIRPGQPYRVDVVPERLDNKLKTGLILTPASAEKGFFYLTAAGMPHDRGKVFALSTITGGEQVNRCIQENQIVQPGFTLAIPSVEEIITFESNNSANHFYAKPNDSLWLSWDAGSNHFNTNTASPENMCLASVASLGSVWASQHVVLDSGKITAHDFATACGKFLQDVTGIGRQYHFSKNINSKFDRLFDLYARTEVFKAFCDRYIKLCSQANQPELLALKESFDSLATVLNIHSLFSDSNLLNLPGAEGLLDLYAGYLNSVSSDDHVQDAEMGFHAVMQKVNSDAIRAFYLYYSLKKLEVFNHTEFNKTFAPYAMMVTSGRMEERYNRVRDRFLSDAVFIGNDASHVALPDIDGKIVSLKDFGGKVVFIDVWASWCGPCKEQAPYLKALAESYAGSDIVFVGISIDKLADTLKWKKAIAHEALPGVQLIDDAGRSFGRMYRVESIPRFMLIDKQGKWREVRCPRPSQAALLRKYIDAALTE